MTSYWAKADGWIKICQPEGTVFQAFFGGEFEKVRNKIKEIPLKHHESRHCSTINDNSSNKSGEIVQIERSLKHLGVAVYSAF